MMYGWYGDGWGIGLWIVMIILMVVFWGAIAAAIVWIVRRRPDHQITSAVARPHGDAERILSERFARGEIDETEFIARRAALRRRD